MTEETLAERLRAALDPRYRIERKLGEGGMASVYLAEDIRHARRVAVKILRPELAAVLGGERFLAEITTTANLQHPHILPLFDSGEVDGHLFYVMPFVEGESLREKLERERQLGVEEAVGMARDVADALDYAHRQGVIHRDIKPANILLHEGRPVVADFGIALAVSAAGGGRMTESGLSLGTPHYMSPEQASADRDLTARSDLYSLGSVLYETLAGQPPHTGPTAQNVLVRILTEPARPVTELRHTVPPHVAAVVARSLEKLPADRFSTAAEMRDALDDPSYRYAAAPAGEGGGGGAAGPGAGRGGGTPGTRGAAHGSASGWSGGRDHTGSILEGAATPWLSDPRSVIAMVLFLIATTFGIWAATDYEDPLAGLPGADAPPIHFALSEVGDMESFGSGIAVAADGAMVFKEANVEGARYVLRPPGGGELRALTPRREGLGEFFAFSPEGERLLYPDHVAGVDRLTVLDLATGEAVRVATLPGGLGAGISQWTGDGHAYGFAVVQADSSYLFRADVASGAVDALGVPRPAGRLLISPRLLPGGQRILYTEMTGDWRPSRVMTYHLATGDTAQVVADAGSGAWSPTGHVLYTRAGGVLEAVEYDPATGEVGTSARLLTGVHTVAHGGRYALSATGTLVYEAGPAEAASGGGAAAASMVLEWVDSTGAAEPIPMLPTDHDDARLSPDGSTVAYIREERVWLYDLVTGSDRPLADDTLGADEHNPVWSPEGDRVIFASERADSEGMDLYVQPVDGSGPARRVAGTSGRDLPRDWHDDGLVLFARQFEGRAGVNGDLWSVRPDEPGSERPLLEGEWVEEFAVRSPDGRWMAYLSRRSGSLGLYVRRFPEMTGLLEVAVPPVIQWVAGAVWGPDGRTVSYEGPGGIHAATLELTGGEPRVVSSRTAVPMPRILILSSSVQDRHPVDGRLLRFRDASVELGDRDVSKGPVVITNFFSEIGEAFRDDDGG